MANNTSTQRTLRKPHKKPDVALTTSSTAVLNKKIRDLTRLLSRTESTLPANVRLENERALEAYKHELSVVKASAQAKKLAMKYRQVRFFERQKASRKVKQAGRALEGAVKGSQERKELKKKLHEAKLELNYTIHFPLTEKYISLYKDSGSDPKTVERKESIKREIAKKMKDGTLGEAVNHNNDAEEAEERQEEKQQGESPKRRKKQKETNDGGGFFEL